MKPSELEASLETAASNAAEGQVIAADVAADRTKATFARVRARQITESLDHEAEKLSDADAATPAVDVDKKQAVDLIEQAGEAIGGIQITPADARAAAQTAEKLEALTRRLETLRKRQ
jgi:phenylalanyl-tRNA synthetase beta subunit